MRNTNAFDPDFIGLLVEELWPIAVIPTSDAENDPGAFLLEHMERNEYLTSTTLGEALRIRGMRVGESECVCWGWNGVFSERFSVMLLKRLIGSLSLNQRRIANVSESDRRASILKYVLDHGHVTSDTFKIAVHDLLIVLGTASDELLRRNSTMKPRNLCSKHALGYAMHWGAIPECSWSAYPYAEQEGPKDYLALADGLLEDVMRQLLGLEDANNRVLADTESEPMRCGSGH